MSLRCKGVQLQNYTGRGPDVKRTARLFRNGRNQAIRLPREMEFEGTDRVSIFRVGQRLIIEPQRRSWLDLSNLEPAGPDFLAERDAPAIDDDRVKL
ncbi:MAG: type II toxin-antitoxin system VapB family antitoxin [Pseudomonadota bacterium]